MKWYHVGIKAKDAPASIRFYRDILGLAVVDTVEIWGKTFTFVGNDTIQIEIEQANPGDTQADPTTMTGLNHFSVLLSARYKDSGRDAYPDILARAPAFFEKLLVCRFHIILA